MEDLSTTLYTVEGIPNTYSGTCPICGSKRFVVNTDKRAFKCYECGEHGPIATYRDALVVELWPDAKDLEKIADIRKNKKGE